jgi:hypothetical protein
MGNFQPIFGTPSFSSHHTDAVASGTQQCMKKRLRRVAVFGRNQIAEPKHSLLRQEGIHSLLEGRIHFDNHSLWITSGGGHRSAFEDGTKTRFCILCCGKL